MTTLKVLPHAIAKFRERTGCSDKKSDQAIERVLLKAVERGREWELRKRFRLKQLLNHDCQPARYFKYHDILIVVADGLVKTVHKAEANRWTPKVPASSMTDDRQAAGPASGQPS